MMERKFQITFSLKDVLVLVEQQVNATYGLELRLTLEEDGESF